MGEEIPFYLAAKWSESTERSARMTEFFGRCMDANQGLLTAFVRECRI